jgi:hypothetical protein
MIRQQVTLIAESSRACPGVATRSNTHRRLMSRLACLPFVLGFILAALGVLGTNAAQKDGTILGIKETHFTTASPPFSWVSAITGRWVRPRISFGKT